MYATNSDFMESPEEIFRNVNRALQLLRAYIGGHRGDARIQVL